MGKTKSPVMEARTELRENTKHCILTMPAVRMLFGGMCRNEWQQHDSNGNLILEYGCAQFPGIDQSLPKPTIHFPNT